MGTVGVQVEEFDRIVENGRQQSEASTFDDSSLDVIQAKLFKRRRRATAVLDGHPERGLAPKCCERCKSDLNGKLMVRCSTCLFRCHLYCFSPPLKQHPAFLIRRQQQSPHTKPKESSPVWKCEKCQGTSLVFNVKPKQEIGSLKTKRVESPRESDLPATTATDTNTTPTSEVIGNKSGWVKQVQSHWIENAGVTFDWYRFRSDKIDVLRSSKADSRSGIDDLVFYSKTYALMKKTASMWRAHVKRRRRYRHQQERETQAMNYPDKSFNLMHIGHETSKLQVEAANEDDLDDADVNLVSFNHYIPYSRRPPRLPLLWKGEAPSALMCWTTAECVEIAEILAEIEEQVCLTSEDVNVVGPLYILQVDIEPVENSAEPSAEKNEILSIQNASIIIQTTFARYRLQRRTLERANRKRRALEETRRRAKARSSIALLRTCIQFVVVLMKMLGQARTKKEMLLVLRDAAEETRITIDSKPTEKKKENSSHQRQQQLAEIRIRRFFVRKVHPYVKLKKIVMVRRLQRWWRQKNRLYKWLKTALAVRMIHRNEACTRIQRVYRHFRIQSRFQALIEKNAFNKLRRTLTRWILSRLAKKEAKRSAVYEAAQLATVDDSPLPPDTPLDEILEKRGMDLYHQNDFWNAAFILERLLEMKKGELNQELQQILAYCHHMTWYKSYDQFNLSRAHELYCSSLETSAGKNPLVLQDLAIVMMHMEHFGDSLRLLAKLIEYFARHPQFSLWLLLAAVQLQQRGEWQQSVEYLTYVHDIPPQPYLERDMLALAAIGYEQLALAARNEARIANGELAKEAWRVALRQWSLENLSTERPTSAQMRGNGQILNSRLKWELLTDLGQRALQTGHYLLTCRVYLYALERNGSNDLERQAAFWKLADCFRHLGHLDLYLNAVSRSENESTMKEQLTHWREQAELQSCSFQTELKTLTTLQKLRQLNGK
ncbi:hypothetical protein P3T76_009148 [Phytophthora citrophthora]|uniref:Uncharacterized protein n=1 Tax=Phytophthora citrophthora TaxID=4793 RepID=A0AAD9GH36_9STRA|nr:hypothetical protein P3T76_009148 [Phytophthora citrophthora]